MEEAKKHSLFNSKDHNSRIYKVLQTLVYLCSTNKSSSDFRLFEFYNSIKSYTQTQTEREPDMKRQQRQQQQLMPKTPSKQKKETLAKKNPK
jgi:hypothetical protein